MRTSTETSSASTIHESRLHRGTTVLAGRDEHVLRRGDDGLRMVAKTVPFVDDHRPRPTLALIA